MATPLLMPKATAVWLIENTSLTFKQIADFCHLHELEVKGIADGDVAIGVKGLDPVTGGQLTREEIAKAEEIPLTRSPFSNPRWTCRSRPPRQARATPRSRAVATARMPSPGSCVITRNCRMPPS